MTSEDSDVKRASAFSLSVFVRKDGLDPDRLIHLYDVAGETFLNNDEHEDQLQYAYAEGAVLLVDPMSIPDLASELEEGLSATDAAVSGRSNPDDVLASLIEKVKSVAKPDRQGRFTMPLAVVLSKADLPGLDEKSDRPPAMRILLQIPSVLSPTHRMPCFAMSCSSMAWVTS